MAIDLNHKAPCIRTLAVHPGFVPTKMTGFEGPDDMTECMDSLVQVIQKLGTDYNTSTAITSGGYYRWNGEKMDY
jgi:hypothetical protein